MGASNKDPSAEIEALRLQVTLLTSRLRYSLATIALALSALREGDHDTFRSEFTDLVTEIDDLKKISDHLNG